MKTGLLGKRNLEAEEEELGGMTEQEMKYAMQAKKANYRKLATAMQEHKKMEDYFLRLEQEKGQLVSFLYVNNVEEGQEKDKSE